MTADRLHTQPAAAAADGVRVCDHCGRPLPALDKNEYTPTRARLVAATGFCVCPISGPDGAARIPDRGPSLL